MFFYFTEGYAINIPGKWKKGIKGDKQISLFFNCVAGFGKTELFINNRLIFLLIISLFLMILLLSVPLEESSD